MILLNIIVNNVSKIYPVCLIVLQHVRRCSSLQWSLNIKLYFHSPSQNNSTIVGYSLKHVNTTDHPYCEVLKQEAYDSNHG
jgi:hypothetical protein